MQKQVFSFFILIICANLSFAQHSKSNKDKSTSVTTAFGSKQLSTALAYNYLWKLCKKQKFAMGAGIRFTSNFGKNSYYLTAPAKLTSGKTGPGVFFSDDIVKNIDSVLFNKSQVNALNISVNFSYQIIKKLSVGFNIDAIGVSFGSNQNGIYYSNNGSTIATTAKPTSFNLLLISDNDKGSLNSEFYANYSINNKWGAKAGFQFLFTEYTTTTKVQTTPDGQKNDRFRNKNSGILIGITYQF